MSLSQTTCNVCVYTDADQIRSCQMCKLHLCKGVSKFRHVCHKCLDRLDVLERLNKNDKGMYLDPVTFQPYVTCKCGLVMYNMAPCFTKLIQGDTSHSPIK